MLRLQLALGAALIVPSLAYAAPDMMSHQGRLVDSAGAPIDGSHTVTVTLWTEDITGTAVFTEDISADFDAATTA